MSLESVLKLMGWAMIQSIKVFSWPVIAFFAACETVKERVESRCK